MDFSKNLQHAIGMGKRFGAAASIYDIYCRGLEHLFGFWGYRVVALSAKDLVCARLPEGEAPVAHELSIAELIGFSAQHPEHLPHNLVVQSHARGDRCVGVVIDGALAAYTWFSRRPTEMDHQLEVRFADSMVYQYKAFTFRAYRGKRLSFVILKQALDLYAQEGGTDVVAYIARNNFPSLTAAKRAGFRVIGTVFVVQRRNWLRVLANRACLRAGVSIGLRQQETLPAGLLAGTAQQPLLAQRSNLKTDRR